MWVGQSCHPALGLQAPGTSGQGQLLSLKFPNPFCVPVSCFLPKAEQPASPRVLLQQMPDASPPQLGRWGDPGGVMTGHHCLGVRMEEAQLSAGTHQKPNQALAAGKKGRAG